MAGQRDRKGRVARAGVSWAPVLVGLLVLLVAGGGVAWFLLRGRDVGTTVVERRPIVKAFYATGTVRPDNEFVLKSRAQGALVELAVRENSVVKKGQVLARVDDKQLRYEVERTAAEVREAEAQAGEESPDRKQILARLKEAREQLKISQSLQKGAEDAAARGASSSTEIELRRRDTVQWSNTVAALESQLGTWVIESQRRLEVAEANLRKAKANLADTEVVSPIDGVVLERYVERGEVVGVNQALLLIAAADDKLMKAAVDEEDVAHVRMGQHVLMNLYAFSRDEDRPFEGKVVEVLPTADPTNKTYEVKVAFVEPPAGLRVGMTAELNFLEETREGALVVPSTAVMDGKVYKVTGRNAYEPVDVKMGIRTLEQVEVTAGLAEGDVIVSDAKQVAPVRLPEPEKLIVPTRKGDVAGG